MIKGGPKIVNDGLVLCLDAHDAKSYAGEPTQNYVINTTSTGGWNGDGSSQTGLGSKGAVAITDENLKYNGYNTVLWTPGTSRNCYLNGSADIPTSETSTEWTFSAYLKYEDGSTISSMDVYMYHPSSDGSSAGTVTDVGGGWFRVRRTRTGSSNYISLAGFTGISAMKKIYISGWQLEKKQYATPVTSPATSRSATDGWVDRSGNSNSGTLTNMIGTETDHYRDGQVIMPVSASYLDFDGSNDYVTLGQSLNNVGSTASIEVWFKSDESIGSSLYAIMFGWGDGTSYYSNFSIGNWFGSWTDESIHLGINSAAVILAERSGHSKYHDGNWHHAVATIGANNYAIYVDGSAVTTSFRYGSQSTSFTNIFNFSSNTYSTIGSRPYTIATGGSGTFNGKIPLVRVYDKILTAAEVLSNYNATKGRFL